MQLKMNVTRNIEYLILTSHNFKYKKLMACFDLDGTIITTKSGKRFPKDANDWKFTYDNVVDKIRQCYNEKYCIVIVTNQKILNNETKENEWITKVTNVCSIIDVPIVVYASLLSDVYRKPSTGFFDIYIKSKQGFYCGDAAGRDNDHSDTDYKFAVNCGLQFYTPENLFLGDKTIVPVPKHVTETTIYTPNVQFVPKQKEIIIFVGYPGSGKSTYIRNNMNMYNTICQDELITLPRCKKICEQLMRENKQIVVDKLCPAKTDRAVFVTLAKKYDYYVRCFHMTTSIELSKHNMTYRYLQGNSKMIPNIAYIMYKKNFVEPDLSEQIDEIVKLYPERIVNNEYLKHTY